MSHWDEHLAREVARYEDGAARLPEDLDARQRQLTRMGNAAGAAGLAAVLTHRAAFAGRLVATILTGGNATAEQVRKWIA